MAQAAHSEPSPQGSQTSPRLDVALSLEALEAEEHRLTTLEERLAQRREAAAALQQEIADLERERSAAALSCVCLRRQWHDNLQLLSAQRATEAAAGEQSAAALAERVHALETELVNAGRNAEDTVEALQTMLDIEREKTGSLEASAEEARALQGLLLQKRCYQCHHQMVCSCEGFPHLGAELSDGRKFDVDGVWVVSVVENGPTHLAGVMPNDVLFEWDGIAIRSRSDMRQALAAAQPHQEVTLAVWRDPGVEHRVTCVLGSSRVKPQGVRSIKLKPSGNQSPASPSRGSSTYNL